MAKIKGERLLLKDQTEIILRSPCESDAEKMVVFCQDMFSNSPYLVTAPDEFQPDVEKQKKRLKDFEANDGSICIIAECNGEIVGNIDFRNRSVRRRIAHRGDFGMGVVDKWHGRGVGRALLERLIKWTKDSELIEKIELGVIVENRPAIELYKSVGFKEEGRISGEVRLEDGSYLDGLVMGLWVKN